MGCKYLTRYVVTKEGFVINKKTGKVLKYRYGTNGYPSVVLYHDDGKTEKDVHRLVAEAFLPNPENLPFVNHKDGNRNNPHVDNLEWCTAAWNSKHSYLYNGRVACKGKENGNTKLEENDVRMIKRMLSSGMKQRDIAKQFGVSQPSIHRIANGKTWGWLEEDSGIQI